MYRRNTSVLMAVLMLGELKGGCATNGDRHPLRGSQSPPPFAGEAEVITGTATPHKQKDSPVETERISGKQLERAGASHVGQVLQDVPAIQPGR